MDTHRIRPYYELTKPRIVMMVGVTAALGYYLAVLGQGSFPGWWHFLAAMAGTALTGGGASVLNQYLERDVDSRMDRTRQRPMPSGAIGPSAALLFGVGLTMGGCFLLLGQTNLLTAFLALQSAFLYVLVYTPMKRLSWWNTSVGAVPGAMPPLMGWAAASGELSFGAWVLFGVLYLWQHPHFFAIAWMYREDYARGGLKMLPVVEPSGRTTFALSLLFAALLVPVALLPALVGAAGMVYFYGALGLGLGLLAMCVYFAVYRSRMAARRVMLASLVYLPGLLAFVWLDAFFGPIR